MYSCLILAMGALASASLMKRTTYSGVATFNDYASQSKNNSDGQNPVSGYTGPACPTTTCGECFQVCNTGGYGGASVGGVGNCVTVNVIDSCPSESAYNFCKTDVPADERCGSSSTNSIDIDVSAYTALTGTGWSSGSPNLLVNISPSSC
ncbi:hypothetical protein N7510_002049 [Penicillium lagena]|uniref:uncharacterized protein n=1 Tax=Penicillium lagena TaxID=94218 RepID=UPI00253FCFCC|nr:uncharacterized protein N7510_002049 [Penicillium lagena]KAJ5625740.1 hypothetical protein N7510_002049 [Penicillium lagena]